MFCRNVATLDVGVSGLSTNTTSHCCNKREDFSR